MKIGPKYKIAKRLGSVVFDKTQTQKFALAESRSQKIAGRTPPKSDYGKQFLEKQRVRFFYGITEKQLKNYVLEVNSKKTSRPEESLFQVIEQRIDNVIYRLGLGKSRRATRQMVSHGHIILNGKKINIPSARVYEGDKIKIRAGSEKSPLFDNLSEKLKDVRIPEWLLFNAETREGVVKGKPTYSKTEFPFDLSLVLEFYSR